MALFRTGHRNIFQCDGGGADESSEEDTVSDNEEEEDEDETDETSEEEEEEDSGDDEEETVEVTRVQKRSTRQSNPSLKPSLAGGAKGRMTRQQAREQMPGKRLLRSGKKSGPTTGKVSSFPCQKCKRVFQSKKALALHTRRCQTRSGQKESPTTEKKSPATTSSKAAKPPETPEGTPGRRGRGRPRKIHVPNTTPDAPIPSTSSQPVKDVDTRHSGRLKSPVSSPGVVDTSSESEYEQREFAANAHQLIQNRGQRFGDATNSNDLKVEDNELVVTGQQGTNLPSEAGPVTCPQCKMTYRTLQGYQNHLTGCLPYSSSDAEEDDEEVDVESHDMDEGDTTSEAPQQHASTSGMTLPSLPQTIDDASNNCLDGEESDSSSSVTSEENELSTEASTGCQPLHNDSEPINNLSEQGLEVMTTYEEGASAEPMGEQNRLEAATTDSISDSAAPEMEKAKTVGEVVKENTPSAENMIPYPRAGASALVQDHLSESQNLIAGCPKEGRNLPPQQPTTYPPPPPHVVLPQAQVQNVCSPVAQNQMFPLAGNTQSAVSSMAHPTQTTTSPVFQSSNNTPTYTQAQLMPSTVLHNSMMPVPQQITSSAETSYSSTIASAGAAPQNVASAMTPQAPQQFPAIVFDPVTQQHVIRFPNNVPPPFGPPQNSNPYQGINMAPIPPQEQNAQHSVPQVIRNNVQSMPPPPDQLRLPHGHPQQQQGQGQHNIQMQPQPRYALNFPTQDQSQGQIMFPNGNNMNSVMPHQAAPHYLPQQPAHLQQSNFPQQLAPVLPHSRDAQQPNLMPYNPSPLGQQVHVQQKNDHNINAGLPYQTCPPSIVSSTPYQFFPSTANAYPVQKESENMNGGNVPPHLNLNNSYPQQRPPYPIAGGAPAVPFPTQIQQQQHNFPVSGPSAQNQMVLQNQPLVFHNNGPAKAEGGGGGDLAPSFQMPPGDQNNVQSQPGHPQNFHILQQQQQMNLTGQQLPSNNQIQHIMQQQQQPNQQHQHFGAMHPHPPYASVKDVKPQNHVQIPAVLQYPQQNNSSTSGNGNNTPLILNPSFQQWNKITPNQAQNPPHQLQTPNVPNSSDTSQEQPLPGHPQHNVQTSNQPSQQQQTAQVIHQIAQYTDASGNTNTVIIVAPAPPQNQNSGSVVNNLGSGVLNLIPGLQSVVAQQQQQRPSMAPQVPNHNGTTTLNIPQNQFNCSSAMGGGLVGRSGHCPCPNCKEKLSNSPGLEKYKKVLPYPSIAPDSQTSPGARPIQMKPAPASKQQAKTIRIQKGGAMLLHAPSQGTTTLKPAPNISQGQRQVAAAGSPVKILPVTMKTASQNPSFGQGTAVGVVLENVGPSRGTPLPNSNVAVVRPMENPLQKLTDQISQIESSFMTPSQVQQQQLPHAHLAVPQQTNTGGTPAPPPPSTTRALPLPTGPHLTLVTMSPPLPPPVGPLSPSRSNSSVVSGGTFQVVTNNGSLSPSVNKVVDGQPRLMLVDHGSPARLSSPNRTPSKPTTPNRTIPAQPVSVKRKLPPSETAPLEPTNKSIKLTLRRKQGGDSYTIKGISGPTRSGNGGTMKSLKIKGQIKSGEQAGTSTDVVVVPCIHLVPIPDPDAGEAEGNRTIAEDESESKTEVSKDKTDDDDGETLSASVQLPVPVTANGEGDETIKLKLTHKAVVVYEVQSNDAVLFRSGDVRAVWGYIFETVQGTRLNHNLPPLFYPATNIALPHKNGHDAADRFFSKFGLTHRAVQFLLEQLPGMKAASSSEFKYTKPPASTTPSEEDVVPENESGCARTESFTGRKPFDMFGWLASKHRSAPTPSNAPMESQRNISAPIPMRFRKLREKADKNLVVWCSKIHGRGLFTRRPIEKEEMVIEYAGEIIRSTVCDIREKFYESKSVGCYMFKVDSDLVIDSTMKGNAARFINHSCEPNCEARVVRILGKPHIIIFALRQIQRGEELTYDYQFEKEKEKIPCSCGSKHCRKYLN